MENSKLSDYENKWKGKAKKCNFNFEHYSHSAKLNNADNSGIVLKIHIYKLAKDQASYVDFSTQ